MLKKMMLLAGMALAVVAFVGTASASASTSWVHWTTIENEEGEPEDIQTTTNEVSEDFTGFAKFTVVPAPANSFGCVVHAHINGTTKEDENGTLTAHGEVTEFEVTTSTCVGTGPAFENCKLETDNSTVPWTLDVNTNEDESIDFSITGVGITNTYEGVGCGVAASTLAFPEITAVPDNATRINCLTLSGTGTSNGTTPVSASGTLCAYHEGTYGVEHVL